jgi:hypothetical protein
MPIGGGGGEEAYALQRCLCEMIFARRVRARAHYLAAETVFTRASKVGPSAASVSNHHEELLDRLWAALRPGISRGGGGGAGGGAAAADDDERAMMQSFVTHEWGEVGWWVGIALVFMVASLRPCMMCGGACGLIDSLTTPPLVP